MGISGWAADRLCLASSFICGDVFFADKTTLACAGAIRKSSPVIVGSLVVMVTALTFSILGSSKHDVKTLIAAILYISAGSVQRREPSYYY